MPRFISGSSEPQTLAQVLECCSVEELKALVDLFAATRKPTKKAVLIALILERLMSDQSARQLWAMLNPTQQAAVSQAVHSPSGTFDEPRFIAAHGKEPDWGREGLPGYHRRYPSLLNLFLYSTTYGETRKVPRDLRTRLLAFVPPPAVPAVRTLDDLPSTHTISWQVRDYKLDKPVGKSEAVPVTRYDSERAAANDLAAVLRLVDMGKVAVSDKTARPSSAAKEALAAVLDGGDFYGGEAPADKPLAQPIGHIRAFAWPLIVQAGGLAELSGTRLRLTADGRKALAAPPHDTLRGLWLDWLETDLLDEFSRVEGIKAYTSRRYCDFTPVEERRYAVESTLKACPPGRWMALADFSRYTVASGNAFDLHDDHSVFHVKGADYGTIRAKVWSTLQERYLLAFLFEYAATLGLIDLGYAHPAGARADIRDSWRVDGWRFLSRYDGLLYLRINPLGAWCLGLADQYVPPKPEAGHLLKVLPNHDIVVTERPAAADVLFLDLFAERASERVWRVDRGRLLRLIEEGGSASEVAAFLAARGDGQIPHTVAVLLDDVARQATRLADRGPARLIEAEDAVLAHLLAHDGRLRNVCFLAGDRHLVVPAASESAFRRALRDLGYALKTPGEPLRPRRRPKHYGVTPLSRAAREPEPDEGEDEATV